MRSACMLLGIILGEGTPDGTVPPSRSMGEGFLCSQGVSSSVRAEPESLEGVSESGLVKDSSMIGSVPKMHKT